jgi:hypothetical protein
MKKKLLIFVLIAVTLVLIAGCVPGTVAQVNTPVPNAQAGTSALGSQINVPGVSIQTFAPGPNPLLNTTGANGQAAGILLGIWHGIISPVTMVLSFVNKDVQMYDVHNDGSQYNLGFLIGVAILMVVLGAGVGSRR